MIDPKTKRLKVSMFNSGIVQSVEFERPTDGEIIAAVYDARLTVSVQDENGLAVEFGVFSGTYWLECLS